MADKKKSLKVTADKKKSLKVVSSPKADKKKSHTKKSLKVTAEKKKSLKLSSPMVYPKDRVKNMKKKLKPDSDIISILRKRKDLYQSDNRKVTPGCVSQPLSEWSRGPPPGVLLGRLVFKEDNIVVDCSKKGPEGRGIPCLIDKVTKFKIISSDALFILLVENDSAYLMLALNEFYNRFPCIMISSEKAIPDKGTRMFLKMLYAQLNLPVLALVDSTAQGLRSLYSYYQNEDDPLNLHIPDIKWLCTRPSHLNEHGIPQNCRLPMKREDTKMVKDLLEYESVKKNPEWVYEFNLMLRTRQMVEIEAFSALDLQYPWEVYIPLMLQEQNWL